MLGIQSVITMNNDEIGHYTSFMGGKAEVSSEPRPWECLFLGGGAMWPAGYPICGPAWRRCRHR
jgi:hypothetical protein